MHVAWVRVHMFFTVWQNCSPVTDGAGSNFARSDCREAVGQEIPIYGYAQHVMTELIQEAEQAGFNEVLTRGQFDRGFARLMS